jgi:hypothetical protein
MKPGCHGKLFQISRLNMTLSKQKHQPVPGIAISNRRTPSREFQVPVHAIAILIDGTAFVPHQNISYDWTSCARIVRVVTRMREVPHIGSRQ